MNKLPIRFDIRRSCAWQIVMLTALTVISGPLAAQDLPDPIKVMSFNIRYGTANDGDNHWKNRSHLVSEAIDVADPDLLGVQEALQFQCQFLQEKFPEYEFFGRGRDVQETRGEYSAIFFRSSRFEKTDGGHFWLSETPDVAGSRSWDAALHRMVTWVSLRDKKTRQHFIYANTHFDHRGPMARLNAAKLIRQRLVEGQELPLVLTGDFNAGFDSEPYRALIPGTEAGDGDRRQMIDTYRVIHPQRKPDEGTFGAWTGKSDGARIDWVLHTSEFTTVNASINYHNQSGQFPSDHFPVQAVIRMR